MKLKFYKYQGTGNDFIMIDNRESIVKDTSIEKIKMLCDRRIGIGADGLILLNAKTGFDFDMKYFNADGREGSMCGNGGRCIVQFAASLGIKKSVYTFTAFDGPHEAKVNDDETVSLKMNDVQEIREFHGDYILNTGSPHYIKPSTNVMECDVYKKGMDIRYSPDFAKDGINVNFVEQVKPDEIIVRTYERGVENETLSCGTGVTAAALAFHHNDVGFNDVTVITKGGRLSVEYDRISEDGAFENIWLTGPAESVFEGIITVDLGHTG